MEAGISSTSVPLEFKDLDSAAADMKETIVTISVNNGWTQEQEDSALSDVDEAYNAVYSDPDYSAFEMTVNFLFPWGYDPEEGNMETVKDFYAYLGSIGMERWKDYPKYEGLMAILGLSVEVSDAALEELELQGLDTKLWGTIKETGEDIKEGGEKILETVTDNKLWYSLGALAALLLTVGFIRR